MAAERMVVILNGMPAAGKSTLAGPLAEALNLPVLSKDVVKETVADILGATPGRLGTDAPDAPDAMGSPDAPTPRQWNGRLGAAASQVLWNLLAISPVGGIVESSLRADVRDLAAAGLKHAGVRTPLEIWCQAPPDVLRRRELDRAPARHSIHCGPLTDDDWSGMLPHAEPLGLGPVLRVDTGLGPVDVDAIASWCRTQHR